MERFAPKAALSLLTALSPLLLAGCNAHGAPHGNGSPGHAPHTHTAAAPELAASHGPQRAAQFDRPGMQVFHDQKTGHLWIFAEGSQGLADFLAHGEPAKAVLWVGEGPGGATIRSDEAETLWAYLTYRPGFKVFHDQKTGHLWIFREGSQGLADFLAHGEPAKAVLWVGEGPRGATIRSDEAETLKAYLDAES